MPVSQWGDGMILQIIALAVAVNIDCSVTGMAYGLAGIRVTKGVRVLISLVAGLIFTLSLAAGDLLQTILPNRVAGIFSVALLLSYGCYLIYHNCKDNRKEKTAAEEPDGQENPCAIFSLDLKFLGIMIQVLRHPSNADCDNDKTISFSEALVLGAALSFDSLGAGLAFGVMGFPIGVTVAVVMLFNYCLMTLALHLGGKLSRLSQKVNQLAKRYAPVIPAVVILALGIWKLTDLFL